MITVVPAQKDGSSGILKIKNWSVAMYLGWNIGGPSKQIEKAMVYYGFNYHSGGGWFGGSGTDHPYTNFKSSWMISAKYNLKSLFSIAIVGGRTNLGSTHGYKIGTWGHYINIDYSLFNISPIFSVNSNDIVRIGVGPSVYFTKAWESSYNYGEDDVEYMHAKVGFLIDFGLRFPKKSLFFFELNGQYRYVGKSEIGPFNENPYRDALPKTEVNFNHLFISGGFGVRF